MTKILKTGLVLSGGGAKGAYHVGVVKALAEHGIEVDIVSGASIGALNGALLATSSSMQEGYERLNEVWQLLIQQSPIKFQMKNLPIPYYLILLASFGLRLNAVPLLVMQKLLAHYGFGPDFFKQDPRFLDNSPLTTLIDKYVNWQCLQQGKQLYVSVYKSKGGMSDLMGCLAAMLSLKDTAPSDFLCLQQLPEWEWKNALMASAALPMLYESQKIGGETYTDGGQGGWKTVQGNTPITPLINAGCNLVLVSHLSDGSFWDRTVFNETTVIELRPRKLIERDGIRDLLAFNATSINDWIEQGYSDTVASISRIKDALNNRNELKKNMFEQKNEEQRMLESADKMQDMMGKIRIKLQ
ncbi:phospholipase, patatin family [Acinetobacter lwoffii SH145]|uniref:patatin-like phospholipase family protein n=1 Tax=Acinetobacter lwoffii TaxID=28090 RepID=UPI0001BBA3A3|nr:patatin-like phospholipase family protein [Acinetobacter lwoffii]EEY90338.1 phospholipase, patatin family [Acinetobacter lwoffii SH145]